MNEMTRKLLPALLSLGCLASAAQVGAVEYEFYAADNTPETQVCMAVASNRPIRLHREMQQHRMSHYGVKHRLLCNDVTVAKFAAQYDLDRTARMLGIDIETSTRIRDIAKVHRPAKMVIAGSK